MEKMAYISLYRKYRPDSFSSMIGQEHIIRTLVNQIRKGAVSHAYLFTGSRGTGKTTTAKIFARAINCEHPLADGSPCGKCAACVALSQPSNMDIVEMDAASNNGVDEIRYLLEKVKFAPVDGKYKVYIVDEVHMLTIQAFNALLKTLEEPPEHTVFILATTEVQKVPATILSRCQRFDFRLVPADKITALLGDIFEKEGKAYQKEALALIAEAGGGCVRDSLSLAEMCLSYSEDEVTYSDVLEVLGACSPSAVVELASDILGGRTDRALTSVKTFVREGKSAGVLSSDLCTAFSNMLYCKNSSKAGAMLSLPEDVLKATAEVAAAYDNVKIMRCLEIFSEVDGNMRYSANPSLVLETAVAKACDDYASLDASGILLRLNRIENQLKAGTIAIGAQTPAAAVSFSSGENLAQQMHTYLVRTLNARGMIMEYMYMSRINESRCSFDKGVWTVEVANNAQKLSLEKYKSDYERVLREKYPDLIGMNVVMEEKTDPVKEKIERVEKIFGADKVNVTQGGKENG